MKKVFAIMLCLVLALSLTGCAIQRHRGFQVSDTYYSARVNDGELMLELKKSASADTWACEGGSAVFAVELSAERADAVTFHITSLSNGSDTVTFRHMAADGAAETHNLTVTISGQPKTQLLIDSVSFVKAD